MSSDYIWSRQHRALVLPIDEKSSIQVLSRSQPVLPMQAEQLERAAPIITSTTTLPVRLRIWNIPSCNVLGKSHYHPCPRPSSSSIFRNTIDAAVPTDLGLDSLWTTIEPTRHTGVQDLEAATREFVAVHNQQPQPFRQDSSAYQT